MAELFVDLHIHSCLSPCADKLMTPGNIVGMAFLKGLDAIAVCDHNTMGNLAAVKAAADMMGVVLLPGIEVTTREEVHVLCYFPDMERALPFGAYIYEHLPDFKNNAAFFGRQIYMNEQDEEIGEEKKLLISATDLSMGEVARACRAHGGAFVPAHIGRASNGALGVLGFLPPDIDYDALEISGGHVEEKTLSSLMKKFNCLRSSDAHRLEDISEKIFSLDATNCTSYSIFCSIKSK
ncbi:MAG: PHP domain-containing protein [Christensenellales bacterium]